MPTTIAACLTVSSGDRPLPQALRRPRDLPNAHRRANRAVPVALGVLTDIEASLGASERDEFLRVLRAAWRALVGGHIDARRLVFVDEMGSNTSLAPLYAWSRRGERALGRVPRNWGANVTLLASMSMEGMGRCLAFEGSTTKAVFETYLKRVLAPSLQPGQVVVMDNLSAHKGQRVKELIEGRGCELLYLPPYSPDLNPIEGAFAKLKGRLRAAAARSREALIEAMGAALDAMMP